jgi:prevent-host-death family protein
MLSSMATVIPQGKLRNQIGAILRRAQRGEHFTVTTNGRPVAELGPLPGVTEFASRGALAEIFAEAPPDPGWADELRAARAEERAAVGEA